MRRSSQNLRKTDVSIIIVSFNTKELTLQCIKSVISSTKGIFYEIIVIDNASTDGSVKAISNFQFPRPPRDFGGQAVSPPASRLRRAGNFHLKIIENQENLGFAKANNQGIKIAKGKYVLLLNSDTVVKKGAVEKLVNFAEKKKDAGVVVPRLLNKDGSIQPSVFKFPTVSRAIKQYWFGQKRLLDKYYPKGSEPREVESAVMAAFLITPHALDKAGLLNEKYFMYFEDLDYCRQIKKAGLKIYYLPKAEIVHYHGASGSKVGYKLQFSRLNQSSKTYHGLINHHIINDIIWLSQKRNRLLE